MRADRLPASRVIRVERYRAMPWRNGRGMTLEIAREPVAGETFAWRLSLADIDGDGDFSAYPGYRRAIVLARGNRLQLRFRGHGQRDLTPAMRGTRFEGDWRTTCKVPEGSCTDLSLIVRRGPGSRPPSIVRAPRMLRVTSSRQLVFSKGLYSAIHVLQGPVVATEPRSVQPYRLRSRDTLLLHPDCARTLKLRASGPAPALLVLLRWRPGREHHQTPGRTASES